MSGGMAMGGTMAMHGMAVIWPMAVMGLITSVAAPALVLLLRRRPRLEALLRPLRWSAPVALVAYVLLHGLITIGLDAHPLGTLGSVGAHLVLLLGAIAFWLPVLGSRHIDAGARAVYLFVGAPALDLAGVIVVARGNASGGLAMIVAMLPVGLVAVILAWQWVAQEEAVARQAESLPDAATVWTPSSQGY